MRKEHILALGLLAAMFILLFFSALNDSATMDELAHIPSGYSYLTQQDYRLNPEHPPLIKDLSAIPLLFLNLNFPTNVPAWTSFVNGQWDMGRIFLYESGNDADKMILFSRLPIMLLALFFGWLFFRWVRGFYGGKVALLSLFFFALSPTFLAHSRYVTTDLGATFGFFIGIAAFLNFLSRNTKKSLLMAGVCFGIAQLLKFSLVILAPIYFLFGFLWVFLQNWGQWRWKNFLKDLILISSKILLIFAIGGILIWLVYLFHIQNYPQERQLNDAKFILQSFRVSLLSDFVVWLSEIPLLRALGQYFLGVLMVIQRSAGGNTAYFLGEVSNAGSAGYFPLLYLLKEYLAFHILTVFALFFGIKNIIRAKGKSFGSVLEWSKENFVLTASAIFILIYWIQAISSPLNIGVRHVLPTFPFIYFLVSREITRWVKECSLDSFRRSVLVGVFLLWMFVSVVVNFPFYLSYYNELAGGTNNGYKIAVDSNYDWGQDLKRLKKFTDDNNIDKMAVDYFGGGNLQYYFGDKGKEWHSDTGLPTAEGISWLAVSLGFLQEARASNNYLWLGEKEPVARAGTSIFIYKF